MFIAAVIVSVLLAAIALASASLKFRPESAPARTIMSLGVPPSWLPRLAAAEIAGAVGLIVGLAWAPHRRGRRKLTYGPWTRTSS